MRKIKLKICGLKSPDNTREILRYKPDYVGFIFYRGSPRYVGDQVGWIGEIETEPVTQKVGVFVNEPVEKILEAVSEAGVGSVQLHGNESPEICTALKDQGLGVIKVFSVGEDFSFSDLERYVGRVDHFLFDTHGKFLGGNGIPFDWSLLENYPYEIPFFLSGGIGPDNLVHVKYLHHPMLFAVDVNSRLESGPGIKDAGLIERFMKEYEKIAYD
jgi:phosphoribosylanthranilate isomerase